MRGMMIKVLGQDNIIDSMFDVQEKVQKGSLFFSNYREANNVLKLKQRNIGAIVAVMKTDYNEYKPYKYFKLKGKLVEQGYLITQKKILQEYREEIHKSNIQIDLQLSDSEKEYQKSKHILKQIPIEDLDNSDLSRYFFETAQWINQKINEGKNVLVHCFKGNSRSPTIILAYLMITQKDQVIVNGKTVLKNWSFDKAQNFLKNITKSFNPNQGFISQLQELERFLNIDLNISKTTEQSGLNLSIAKD